MAEGEEAVVVPTPAKTVEEEEPGPGTAFSLTVLMEDFFDKLKLLNYDKDYLKSSSFKPLFRHYFAIATNPGEQFFNFTNIAAWLIQKAGNPKFERPQEYDDPNATISKILDELRKLDVTVDFAPSKLKAGAGQQCVFVLDKLADAALRTEGFSWNKPAPVSDFDVEDTVAVDEAEITAEQFEEVDEAEDADDDDEGGFLDLEGLRNLGIKKITEVDDKKEILVSDTDATAWKLEVERVMPSLRITIRPDAKDWRAHLEQMQQYKASIQETLNQTQGSLERLTSEIGRTMDKIASREKYLNQQLESLLHQFRQAQDRLAETKEKYKEASGGVTERSRLLQQITEDLEQVKHEMEERGASLSDGAPLVKIKQAISKLQQEIVGLDVQIGAIEQSLLQAQLRDRTNLHYNMSVAATGNSEFVF